MARHDAGHARHSLVDCWPIVDAAALLARPSMAADYAHCCSSVAVVVVVAALARHAAASYARNISRLSV